MGVQLDVLPKLRNNKIGEESTTEEIIGWTLDRFADQRLVMTTSFGMEGCALIDMYARHNKPLTVVYLDTMFFFPETYALRDRMAERYPLLDFVNRGTTLTPEEQAAEYGDELWKTNPDACCKIRKVDPMVDVMADVDVWITGLRRSQSSTRGAIKVVEWDWQYQVIKISPIWNWDRAQIWEYIQQHNVPYNDLHEQGYPTVGCTHCTKPVPGSRPGDYSRGTLGRHRQDRMRPARRRYLMPENDWQSRLAVIVDMMRDLSRHTDPQAMVRSYGDRVAKLMTIDQRLSLSRRELSFPHYRITRSTTWKEEVNPWKEKDRLPLLRGGLLAKLIYAGEPCIIDNLEVSDDDPAADYLAGHRSLLAIPMFDAGESLNMVVILRRESNAFSREQLPDITWTSNLFGRATNTLVVKEQLREAYQELDREFNVVAEIQQTLLPAELPKIPGLELAAHYQPARRAGGDYYDFFPLPDGRWGIFIGDVSGHGTPAAVLMAVTHCIAHTHPGPPMPPHTVLEYLNSRLATTYASFRSTFVTAFYAIYCPVKHTLTYASAGHNPPRLKRCFDGSVLVLDGTGGLPLGVQTDSTYVDEVQPLQAGDQIIFYTDGITEARNPSGELFGVERLDRVLENCTVHVRDLLNAILMDVEQFTNGQPPDDDRTIVIGRVG